MSTAWMGRLAVLYLLLGFSLAGVVLGVGQ
jgi:hypothetical protein